ncbi:phage baseplate assembly protein V [Rhizobium sp. 60-20]|uniref:phage baseplate assembly protein V n=1 Tax=Rhizobium sp. 60-20 TaxID=1895819 RepID=UPI00092A0DDE|nr:phage baseplate assembly protein V [Rhizobium sp. 60-20]OJY66453.1 MAG: hypothetical protein BGP09_31505 [Rhizobium sp. 60-20]
MTGDIEDLVRRIVDQHLSRQARERAATITAYDPNRHAVKAQLQPEGVETGWMPIGTAHVGNGFGIAIGPQIGDQIVVGFHDGDPEAPYMKARLHSDQERPPVAQAGEMVFQTAAGFILKADQSGAVTLTLNGQDFTIDAGGGNVHINSAGLFHNGKSVGDTHEHTDVTPGPSNTGPPV